MLLLSAGANHAPFRLGLTELGYVDGNGVVIEYRRADGQRDRVTALVAELVRRPAAGNASDQLARFDTERRTACSLLGLGAFAVPATVLTLSSAEAQTPGMERREERRDDRQDRREDRRENREERRDDRQERRDERRDTQGQGQGQGQGQPANTNR
jgi:hypothetical protein